MVAYPSPRFGALAGKYGPRLFMTLGPLLAASGFLLMLLFDQHAKYAGVASAVNNAISRITGLITIATAILMSVGAIISAIGIRNPGKVNL